jgi:hypothetical protein
MSFARGPIHLARRWVERWCAPPWAWPYGRSSSRSRPGCCGDFPIAEHRLNATDAAGRLGISRQRFARVVKQAGLEPVAEEQVRKYRRLLTVRYYRAADVDALQPYVGADIALREAATAVGRSDAAQKAARTRARNRERAREARLELGVRRA